MRHAITIPAAKLTTLLARADRLAWLHDQLAAQVAIEGLSIEGDTLVVVSDAPVGVIRAALQSFDPADAPTRESAEQRLERLEARIAALEARRAR